MKAIKTKILFALLLLALAFQSAEAQQQNWLSVSGNKLYDTRGQEVRLTGVNWFGFETSNLVFHGLWSRDMISSLEQIKSLGFNTIRLPWCNDMLQPGAKVNSIQINPFKADPFTGRPTNTYLEGITEPIKVLDIVVEWCQENDMKIVLDNHSRAADGFLNEDFWYTDEYSEEKWIEDWLFIVDRYKAYSAVVGADLNNEPHGSDWGSGNLTVDWDKAAERCGNAILEVNPNILIIVEGVGTVSGGSYWWGGNLLNAGKNPVNLSNPGKLMYSAHEYGPEVFNQAWFSSPNFPANLNNNWDRFFHYLYDQQISPIFAGEFGIKNQNAFDGVALTWFKSWLNFMADDYSWTFWCWNPNSGDTGGLLEYDWATLEQWKLDLLTPHLAPSIPNVVSTVGNLPPKVLMTPHQVRGKAPFTADFAVLAANDPEGGVLQYTWQATGGATATGNNASFTFTEAGEYRVTLTATDPAGLSGQMEAVVIVKDDNPNGNPCAFGTPLATPLPTTGNSVFNKVYVLGDIEEAPVLDNINDFTINWDLGGNGLEQFSILTTNGSPNWWNDLKGNLTHTFGESLPAMTLAGTGFGNLDGDYFVTVDEGNFVMVSQDRGFTLYFSNSDSIPTCGQALNRSINGQAAHGQRLLSPYPNPSQGNFTIQFGQHSIDQVRLTSVLGQQVATYQVGNTPTLVFGEKLLPGTYIIQWIKAGQIVRSGTLIKQ